MANEGQIIELRNYCNKVLEIMKNETNLIQRTDWGKINFKSIESHMNNLTWISERLDNLPLELVPEINVANATVYFQQTVETLNRINNFSIDAEDEVPTALRDQLSSDFQSSVQQIFEVIAPWIPVMAFRTGEIKNWSAEMEEHTRNASRILEKATRHVEERTKEIDKAAQAARAAAGEAGAAEFTHEFREEARAVENRNRWWLSFAALFTAAALFMSLGFAFDWFEDVLSNEEEAVNAWEVIYRLGGRVIAVSVLFYAAIWSGRIVLANMHLASVNRHRAISLQTLQAFHKAADDPAAKDAVVLEAARAVYENVPSGYVARQAGGAGGPGRMIEVIRGANRGPSGSGAGQTD